MLTPVVLSGRMPPSAAGMAAAADPALYDAETPMNLVQPYQFGVGLLPSPAALRLHSLVLFIRPEPLRILSNVPL